MNNTRNWISIFLYIDVRVYMYMLIFGKDVLYFLVQRMIIVRSMIIFKFNLREETGFVSTSIDNRQPLESLNMSEVPLNSWESQIQIYVYTMYIHFSLLSETKYYKIGIWCLSALRHTMTGWLWHMIMCQSGWHLYCFFSEIAQ